MSQPDRSRSIQYYDSIAPDYDAQMERVPFNGWARAAFRQLVISAFAPPASVLDFGCGTGIDTEWLAARGYSVIAYDRSSGMMRELRRKCAELIDQGRVITCEGSFTSLLDLLKGAPPLDAVIANFAVFNLIRDPRPIFAGLAPHVRPGGRLFLSVLNPMFWKDLGSLELWVAWLRSLGRPAIHISGETELYKHRVRALRRAAQPCFRLVHRASVGFLVRRVRRPLTWGRPRTLAERIEARVWTTFPATHLGQFFFLTLERQ